MMLMAEDALEQQRKQFGRWLARMREEVGYGTQQQVADAAGISRIQWARWESGASLPSRKNIPAIARVVRVSVEEVYRRAFPPPPPEDAPMDTGPPPEGLRDVIPLWEGLSDRDRQEAADFIRWMFERKRRGELSDQEDEEE
jgi:transcriptional regulator with XRE-family HTH domain